MRLTEFQLIDRISRWAGRSRRAKAGIGDDCAAIPCGDKYLLWTTDALVEGVDFQSKEFPSLIGRKALAINLSDIAAMGGIPTFALVTLGFPKKTSVSWVHSFYRGFLSLARRFKVELVGGDLSKSEKIFCAVSLLGKVEKGKMVLRHGTRAGDEIFVTGLLGGSLLGHHLRFMPRVYEAQELVESYHPTSMIDVSDGLTQDLTHLLGSSRVGAHLFLDRIPISKEALRMNRGNRQRALLSALSDGEDFELLFTLNPREARGLIRKGFLGKTPVHRIGRIVSGRGLRFFKDESERKRIRIPVPAGYRHF